MSQYNLYSSRRAGHASAKYFQHLLLAVFAFLCMTLLNGCGGGYAGTVPALISSHITIDGGQTFVLVATNPQNLPLNWSVSGAGCSGNTCGVLSQGSVTGVTFTAPQVTQQLTVTVQAAVTGTPATTSTTIVVNPAPKISGSTPDGTVGTAYSATFAATGGTGMLKWQPVQGTVPPGLTFSTDKGILSGTPTAAGKSTFTLQAIDSSDVPFTVTASFTVTINTASNGGGTTPGLKANGSTPDGTVNTPYVTVLQGSGGTAPYTWTITTGSLPTGLTLSSSGVIFGTPTVAGKSTFTVQVQDAASATATLPLSLTIQAASQGATLTLTTSTLPSGTVQVPYASNITITGGTAPYTCTLVSGSVPEGLTLNGNCTVTGTPTTAGTSSFTTRATDSANPSASGTGQITLVINPAGAVLTIASPPTAVTGVPYDTAIPITGGTSPYHCVLSSGAMPAGLTLNADCTISGIPIATGTVSVGVTATDSANPANSNTATITISVQPPVVVLNVTPPPVAIVGVPYTGSILVTGGTAPYQCTLVSGSLPNGLTLNADCTITGTPQTPGTSTFGVTVTDSASPANTNTTALNLTVEGNQATLTITAPPVAVAGIPYLGPIVVAGGVAPYTCTVASGTLPNGLTLGTDCIITGTPTTAGTSTVSITATDSATPANTKTAPIAITVQGGSTLVLTIAAPPIATVGIPYLGPIVVAGGVAPYTCTVASGTLPNGLTLGTNCIITGTPTTAGATTVNITATDSATPSNTKTAPITITVAGGIVTITITAPPVATVNLPYIGAILVAGGIAPYHCAIASGSLPHGLTLGTNCVITGTPTTAGTSTVNITATDSANPANSKTAPVTITVLGGIVTITITAPPVAVVHLPYVGLVLVAGGTAPYTCTIASGTLPNGLTLGTNCIITGTPTTAGTSTVSITATDSASPANSKTAPISITVLGPQSTLTVSSPADATVSTPYTGAIPVTGGTAPYQCVVNSGSLPAGLALGANCTITGTPTTAGTSNLNVTATDSSTPAVTGSGNITLTVKPISALTLTGTLPNATLGQQYSQTLNASGGLPPYTYAVTSGSLPSGLSLSTAGILSGTPTTIGATSFTITATDSQSTPQKASLPLTLQVVYPTTPSDALLNGPYAFLFQGYDDVIAGVLAYQTATVGSFTADGNGLLTAGELDSNHQGSNPTGNTIATNNLLGSYTLGTDGRGTIAITTLQADGTAGATALYSIAVKLPTGTATAATSGNLIESDGTILLATKGSGTLLAQSTSANATGLHGSYAFGLSGDTPCLPSCTIGILAGPAATVGQFTTGSGTLSGTGDTNIASMNYASSTLGGSFTAADNNGRIDLTLTSAELASLPFPTHYALYVVDASHAFLMSTDKHSSFILQAGTAQLQTQTTFNNASLNGPYVGYENAAVNPGLVGSTLSSVLNLSSATIFRGTGNANGTCTTTNVDVGGLTGLVNTITGLGSGSSLLNDLLGTYQALGNSNCHVAANGRAVLNYPDPQNLISGVLGLLGLGNQPAPPRVVYLTGNNEGYFLESGYAGLGQIAAQTGSPFKVSTLQGTFTYGTVPASSLVTIDGDGSFTADGAGHATSTLDTNVGVGNLNLLDLGVSNSTTYSLTDAAAGRYLLGGTRVIYALSPDRYVLLETSPLSTAPYVATLF